VFVKTFVEFLFQLPLFHSCVWKANKVIVMNKQKRRLVVSVRIFRARNSDRAFHDVAMHHCAFQMRATLQSRKSVVSRLLSYALAAVVLVMCASLAGRAEPDLFSLHSQHRKQSYRYNC
jgi:hypothetical protein